MFGAVYGYILACTFTKAVIKAYNILTLSPWNLFYRHLADQSSLLGFLRDQQAASWSPTIQVALSSTGSDQGRDSESDQGRFMGGRASGMSVELLADEISAGESNSGSPRLLLESRISSAVPAAAAAELYPSQLSDRIVQSLSSTAATDRTFPTKPSMRCLPWERARWMTAGVFSIFRTQAPHQTGALLTAIFPMTAHLIQTARRSVGRQLGRAW